MDGELPQQQKSCHMCQQNMWIHATSGTGLTCITNPGCLLLSRTTLHYSLPHPRHPPSHTLTKPQTQTSSCMLTMAKSMSHLNPLIPISQCSNQHTSTQKPGSKVLASPQTVTHQKGKLCTIQDREVTTHSLHHDTRC
jgi:hypothetical protein